MIKHICKFTDSATARCISIRIKVEPIYNGWRPNSSLNGARTKGNKAKPNAYMLRPTVAWYVVQFKSRLIEVYPIAYVEAIDANEIYLIKWVVFEMMI